jgi:hypothetical protein
MKPQPDDGVTLLGSHREDAIRLKEYPLHRHEPDGKTISYPKVRLGSAVNCKTVDDYK